MLKLTPLFDPPQMVGMKIDLKDPFHFDFIMDQGQAPLSDEARKAEFQKIIQYFLLSLTMPNKDMWVNLSPYEHQRMVPEIFGQTRMGRDLLAQDYVLKQLTSSLIYPEDRLGRAFWQAVYQQAQKQYGTTDIRISTFNKVWIVADHADIYQKDETAFLVNSHLKVVLAEDYEAMRRSLAIPPKADGGLEEDYRALHQHQDFNSRRQLSHSLMKKIILPVIEKEVNEGRSFAILRQIYNAEIMATWFKKALRQGLLGQVFADKSKIAGQKLDDQKIMEKIYQLYLKAYKKGVFNYIRDEKAEDGGMVPRKYFSGGVEGIDPDKVRTITPAMIAASSSQEKEVRDFAQSVTGRLGRYVWTAVGLAVLSAGMVLVPGHQAQAEGLHPLMHAPVVHHHAAVPKAALHPAAHPKVHQALTPEAKMLQDLRILDWEAVQVEKIMRIEVDLGTSQDSLAKLNDQDHEQVDEINRLLLQRAALQENNISVGQGFLPNDSSGALAKMLQAQQERLKDVQDQTKYVPAFAQAYINQITFHLTYVPRKEGLGQKDFERSYGQRKARLDEVNQKIVVLKTLNNVRQQRIAVLKKDMDDLIVQRLEMIRRFSTPPRPNPPPHMQGTPLEDVYQMEASARAKLYAEEERARTKAWEAAHEAEVKIETEKYLVRMEIEHLNDYLRSVFFQLKSKDETYWPRLHALGEKLKQIGLTGFMPGHADVIHYQLNDLRSDIKHIEGQIQAEQLAQLRSDNLGRFGAWVIAVIAVLVLNHLWSIGGLIVNKMLPAGPGGRKSGGKGGGRGPDEDKDQAMFSLARHSGKDLGGIDLNNEHLMLRIKVDGAGLPLPARYQDRAMLNLNGMTAAILNIKPLTAQNIPELFAMAR